MSNIEILHGDCLAVLRTIPDCSVDSIVTDPPYGLNFMGRKWDYDVPGVDVWAECLRVLKPGGHLLAFAGTRTQHRMAMRIEDAGFEIRDMIAWVYGSGFPKSLDVSKAIDKAAGAEREVVGKLRTNVGIQGGNFSSKSAQGEVYITAPATEAAQQWQGWGTALKPALEPITLARKPLFGTVAANVLEHGTGALNIDGCRVAPTGESRPRIGEPSQDRRYIESGGTDFAAIPGTRGGDPAGRWPANLMHDGSDEVLQAFPHSHGQKASVTGAEPSNTLRAVYDGLAGDRSPMAPRGDTGSSARFFYCAKASRADRNEGTASGDSPAVATSATMRERENANWQQRNGNHHPTVKPTELMAYLCRLVTPPGGLVLDPFMGSGSTGKAAIREGFRFTGIERESEYVEIARKRIQSVLSNESSNLDLFASAGLAQRIPQKKSHLVQTKKKD